MVVGLPLRLGAAAAAAQGALASAVLAAPAEVGPGAALVAVIVSAAAGVAAGRRLAALAGDVERLARDARDLGARLARERDARAHLIGKVSHELRTPVTVIKGFAYTLRRTERDPARAAKLDIVDGECEHLAYLIEGLLEVSRAQADELRLADGEFPLRDCVERVVERLRTVAEQRGVAIDLRWSGNGAAVRGDENRVRQIFANLLTNGIKYAPPGTSVSVSGDTSGRELAVTVADCGRGIADADLPRIFDEFYQAPDRSEPGAGLGLAIARELAIAHGGRIDVASAEGAGARFTVVLPAAVAG
jgi:signal transduction histidine kinase